VRVRGERLFYAEASKYEIEAAWAALTKPVREFLVPYRSDRLGYPSVEIAVGKEFVSIDIAIMRGMNYGAVRKFILAELVAACEGLCRA